MIQGKTVIMVTHRKALLALMDTIYVLENSTLTNVSEIGGLDAYLAKLEGLEIELAQVDNETIEPIETNTPVTPTKFDDYSDEKFDSDMYNQQLNNEQASPMTNDIVVGSMEDNDPDATEDNEGTIRIDHHQ